MSLLVRLVGLIFKSKHKICSQDNYYLFKNNIICKEILITNQTKRCFSDIRSSYVPFDDVILTRRSQAKRSILVQVNSERSFPELHSYCSKFGSIVGVHHYSLSNGEQHFMLIEFDNESAASDLVSSGVFAEESEVIPVKSSFLWFRSLSKEKKTGILLTNLIKGVKGNNDATLEIINGCEIPSEALVTDIIFKSNDISEQMYNLYKATRLNDLGTRLRYMVARQVENVVEGLYPDAIVSPFGSTVNGFGKMGCDLDLLLKYTPDSTLRNTDSRLVFHTKKSIIPSRTQNQRHMEVIGDIIQLLVPGCSHIRRILHARIPIIKYNQDYVGVECDLSMTSMSGVYMSELLYMFGCFDSRVRPLVFTVRKWAVSIGLTNPSPGKWITNFPLTLMVLFFLQNTRNGAVLPNFNSLKRAADVNDARVTEDFVNCTFLRDIRKVTDKFHNESSLGSLLHEFFEFYSAFDFATNALSINEGTCINKPDHSPLYIANPLESNLNVSKNVSFEECERLRIEMRNSAWQLESLSDGKSSDKWGLGAIFKFKELNILSQTLTPHRLVAVKDLFFDDHTGELPKEMKSTRLKDILEMSPEKIVSFKSREVKKQIEKIKKKTVNEINNQKLVLNVYGKSDDNQGTYRKKTRRR